MLEDERFPLIVDLSLFPLMIFFWPLAVLILLPAHRRDRLGSNGRRPSTALGHGSGKHGCWARR
jgi:hypothetical protein